jgi:hypothetical protein
MAEVGREDGRRAAALDQPPGNIEAAGGQPVGGISVVVDDPYPKRPRAKPRPSATGAYVLGSQTWFTSRFPRMRSM